MKTLLIFAIITFSSSLFAGIDTKDWLYKDSYPTGGKMRYDAWTSMPNHRSFTVSCDVDYRRGEPEIRFFIETFTPIHNLGEDIVVTLKFDNDSFELPAKVSIHKQSRVFVYPFVDRHEIINLMKSETAFDIFIPTASGGAHIRQSFSLMGFKEASLGLRKICKV